MNQNDFEVIVEKDASPVRIDLFLHKYLSSSKEVLRSTRTALSRTRIQDLIREQKILVNERTVRPNHLTKPGDRIRLEVPIETRTEVTLDPERIYFEVLYNDPDILVINKPEGLVVHPAAGHYHHTLLHGLVWLFPELKKEKSMVRMGMVHRLDRDTSGVLVMTKNDFTQLSLTSQFKERTIRKEYVAIVMGIMKESEGEISSRIGRHPGDRKRMAVLREDGKESLTRYKVLRYLKNATFVKLMPHTGRTHQLRVHMHHIRHPIVGDNIYCPQRTRFHDLGLMLCARKIRFFHPRLRKEMEFEVGLPDRFQIILNKGEC